MSSIIPILTMLPTTPIIVLLRIPIVTFIITAKVSIFLRLSPTSFPRSSITVWLKIYTIFPMKPSKIPIFPIWVVPDIISRAFSKPPIRV
ncbi:hypothetical protein OIU77_010631 [Salix suchowensis]|uniref:Uncharacterized protein n=1 Tax=Salix suchowensis TaxID=1278906 RepID=A0ABQ9A931_9ROSI|nr:hypothetical protein OIU77_010631 [Salix suchowensis]